MRGQSRVCEHVEGGGGGGEEGKTLTETFRTVCLDERW